MPRGRSSSPYEVISRLLAVEIRVVKYGHPDAVRLVAEVQEEYVGRYGSGDASEIAEDHFELPSGLFAVGYLEGEAVATGAWRALTDLEPGDAEIKRMYVRGEARGRGLAREMLRFLERTAREQGRTRMVLETGDRQPEAVALYKSEGYMTIPGFGHYRDHPASISLGKKLPA